MLNKKKNSKGFTLVELLVVIAIIGILAVVAVPALFKNIEKGKVADLESDISAIRSAVLSYYTDNSEYPMDTTTTTTTTDGKKDSVDSNTIVELSKTSTGEDKPESSVEGSENTTEKTSLSGTRALLSELEGLSFPYEGTYKLTDETGEDVATSPDTLYLTITTQNSSTTISADGLDKLAQDLGLTNPTPAITSGQIDKIAVTKTGDKQTIIIPLVNKQ